MFQMTANNVVWARVGCRGPSCAFDGLRWPCIGLRWSLLAFVGLRVPLWAVLL